MTKITADWLTSIQACRDQVTLFRETFPEGANLDADVRYYVARHPSTPAAVLETLSKDTDADVRCGVAQNPSTPNVKGEA